jgi:methionyl-tRNA synthetase
MKNKFYITTPIYYINAKPHIGSAYTTIAADVLARYHRMIGDKTFFLTGTDEHGEKNEAIAKKEKIDPQEYADKMSAHFELAWDSLNVSNDGFIRTTNKDHKKAAQKALQYMYDKGYIYKGEYSGLYCSGCEQYKTEKDLVDGLCPDHKTKPVEMSEESYMFKMSAFSDQIKKAIENDELRITPEGKKKEILSFYKDGLNDISFSRTNTTWGVELPWDKKQVSYVWPDAFLNYLTGLGWDGGTKAPEMWPADIHLMSKDILRVHATIWPAMLLALGLSLPRRLFVHGFFLVEGQKMSKSIGNVIAPDELIKKYGVDATRYLLMDVTPFGNDGDVSWDKFDEKFNADLANGLGNLAARSIALVGKMKAEGIKLKKTNGETDNFDGHAFHHGVDNTWNSYIKSLNELKIESALKLVGNQVRFLDNYITTTKPWALIKEGDGKVGEIMYNILERIRHIALMLWPFMPETSDKILEALGFDLSKEREKDIKKILKWGGLNEKSEIKKAGILFPRI